MPCDSSPQVLSPCVCGGLHRAPLLADARLCPVSLGTRGRQSRSPIYRAAGSLTCAGRHRHRRTDVHVRGGRAQAPDQRHRVRRRTWRSSRRSSWSGCSETSAPFSEPRTCPNAPDVSARLPGAASTAHAVRRRSPLFFLALLVGAATFNLFYSLLAGWPPLCRDLRICLVGTATIHRCCEFCFGLRQTPGVVTTPATRTRQSVRGA